MLFKLSLMSFVEQEDILNMFEGMIKSIFKSVKDIDYTEQVQRITWEQAMWQYGNDKPDIRFSKKAGYPAKYAGLINHLTESETFFK